MGKAKFEVYDDAVGEQRWRVTKADGEIMGASTEGFVTADECVRDALELGIAILTLHAEERLQ